MINALTGFVLLAVIVLLGWALRRWGGLPDDTEAVLSRVAYLALAPCLLFEGTANAELRRLAGGPLLVSALAALICFAVFAVLFVRRDRGTRILGALTGGYTNANYIGIPVATYVLGDASLVVPIVLFQLLVVTPVALTLLEAGARGAVSGRSVLVAALGNPLVVAVTMGALSNLTGVRLPSVLAGPITTVGQAAVPVVLIALGMSLSGRRVLAAGPDRLPTVVAVLLKTAGMPLVAFLLAAVLGLGRDAMYQVTVLAALPAAQNLYLYAQRAGTGPVLVRDAIFLSTVCCVPVMLVVTLLLGS